MQQPTNDTLQTRYQLQRKLLNWQHDARQPQPSLQEFPSKGTSLVHQRITGFRLIHVIIPMTGLVISVTQLQEATLKRLQYLNVSMSGVHAEVHLITCIWNAQYESCPVPHLFTGLNVCQISTTLCLLSACVEKCFWPHQRLPVPLPCAMIVAECEHPCRPRIVHILTHLLDVALLLGTGLGQYILKSMLCDMLKAGIVGFTNTSIVCKM